MGKLNATITFPSKEYADLYDALKFIDSLATKRVTTPQRREIRTQAYRALEALRKLEVVGEPVTRNLDE